MMECPMCFQRIIVPQAPAGDDVELIIKGSKATKRLATKPETNLGRPPAPRPPAKDSPVAGIAFVILLCAAIALAFVFREKIFKSAPTQTITVENTSNSPPNTPVSPPKPISPHGAIGLGSWSTFVQYTNIVVTSNGVTLYQSDFVNSGTSDWRVYNGAWSINRGLYQQTAIITDCRSTTGNTNWANYTITLQARKVSGSEGFLILFNWLDDDNWTWWNIGGWNNTFIAIEQMSNGVKSRVGSRVAGGISANQWYTIRIVLTGPRIQCYLNDRLIHEVNYATATGVVPVFASYGKVGG
jgi:hypothetical protein